MLNGYVQVGRLRLKIQAKENLMSIEQGTKVEQFHVRFGS